MTSSMAPGAAAAAQRYGQPPGYNPAGISYHRSNDGSYQYVCVVGYSYSASYSQQPQAGYANFSKTCVVCVTV